MNKAFLFDMDGVIVDSERSWEKNDPDFLKELFGEKVASSIGEVIGISIEDFYEKAVKMGVKMDRDEYYRIYDEHAKKVYEQADITQGVGDLAQNLFSMDIKLGLVTSSRRNWINFVLPRITFAEKIETIICMPEYPHLRRKPEPDGYLEAMKELRVRPENTIVLEDSNTGIRAGRRSGAYVIGFKENLSPNYHQQGANVWVHTMRDILEIVKLQFKIIK